MAGFFPAILVASILVNLGSLLFFSRKTPRQLEFTPETLRNFTFVSVPRPVRSESEYFLLRLAISNWISTSQTSRVVLVVDPLEFDVNRTLFREIERDFGPGRLIYQYTLQTNRNKVPYISNWFKSAVQSAPFSVLTLINSDIFLPAGWVQISTQLLDIFGGSAFITGYRLNFDMDDEHLSRLKTTESYLDFDIEQFVHSCDTHPYSYRGMDFFTFLNHPGTNFFKLFPPFLMGKYEWDNWLMGKMSQAHQTISMGPDFRVYHVNHPATANKRWSQDSTYNKRLRLLNFALSGDNRHTKWTLVNRDRIVSPDGTVLYL
jgi:hypothetical protein